MPKQQPEPRFLAIGRIVRPHGVRGEVQMEILTDYPEHVADIPAVYVGPQRHRYEVKRARLHKKRLLLHLKGINDRDAAETLRGQLVEVAIEDAVPLEVDEYYEFQLVGLDVETEEGQELGELVGILDTMGANDVYVVHGLYGEILLPAIEDVVREVDLEAGRMIVHLLPGLWDGP
jgi:16S rRNA processing protein RimM